VRVSINPIFAVEEYPRVLKSLSNRPVLSKPEISPKMFMYLPRFLETPADARRDFDKEPKPLDVALSWLTIT
jgi:hypothetical protein